MTQQLLLMDTIKQLDLKVLESQWNFNTKLGGTLNHLFTLDVAPIIYYSGCAFLHEIWKNPSAVDFNNGLKPH